MMSMHGYPTVALSGHPQLFLQQNLSLPGRPPIYKVAPTHGTQHSLLPPVSFMGKHWIKIMKHYGVMV
jgi:hypothetical protein